MSENKTDSIMPEVSVLLTVGEEGEGGRDKQTDRDRERKIRVFDLTL